METTEIVEGLAGFADRGAGTDAERRAAAWLAAHLSSDGQEVTVETFWCRPNWALAHALHAALAVVGSLLSLLSPVAGVTVLAITLASILSDSLIGRSVGRQISRERASQNVLLSPAEPEDQKPVRLILTANYDAGRTGAAWTNRLRRPTAAIRKTLRSNTPGWLGWLAVATTWLLAIAIVRLHGHTSRAVGVAQLPPTVALMLGFVLLLDMATSRWSPAAGDNATGVGVAVTLARAIQTAPPQHLDVDLVLSGAGAGDQLGLRRHLRSRRRERKARDTVVLGIASCAAGRPCWWFSDGPLVPLRYARPLRGLAQQIASEEPHLHGTPHKGRGSTPALPARTAGIPAITIGCLDEDGISPGSHQRLDTADAIDRSALDAALQFALLLIDAIDSEVGEREGRRAATPA